jgi:hypothetical protein
LPHPIKAHGIVEAYLHSFSISVQVEVIGQLHERAALTSVKVKSHRAGLEAADDSKTSYVR